MLGAQSQAALALSHGELGNKAAAAADPGTTSGTVLENKRASVRDQLPSLRCFPRTEFDLASSFKL